MFVFLKSSHIIYAITLRTLADFPGKMNFLHPVKLQPELERNDRMKEKRKNYAKAHFCAHSAYIVRDAWNIPLFIGPRKVRREQRGVLVRDDPQSAA